MPITATLILSFGLLRAPWLFSITPVRAIEAAAVPVLLINFLRFMADITGSFR